MYMTTDGDGETFFNIKNMLQNLAEFKFKVICEFDK